MKYFYNGINQICQQIIRPVRADYQQYDLGALYSSGEQAYQRQDFDLVNQLQQKLKVSVYSPQSKCENCIIYLHSANGSRMEVYKYIETLIKQNFILVTFDFSGSGLSEGDTVTYGHQEIHDLQSVIIHMHSNVKHIILWGRSMGSVVALLYMQKFHHPQVVGLILDSPFLCLQDVVVQMASKRTRIPNFILSTLSGYVSEELKKLAGFSLEEINCLANIKSVKIPAFFITSKQDTVVPAEQTEKLFINYQGMKQIHYTGMDHNSTRDCQLIEKILLWFKRKNPIFDKVGVGTRIKNKIMNNIPIRQIDLNCFSPKVSKERSATFDIKESQQEREMRKNCSISPKNMSKLTPEQRYLQLLKTQRSLYLDQSIKKVNMSVDVSHDSYFSNKNKTIKKDQIKEVLKLSQQQNYFNNHFKPVVFTKVPNKTKDGSHKQIK